MCSLGSLDSLSLSFLSDECTGEDPSTASASVAALSTAVDAGTGAGSGADVDAGTCVVTGASAGVGAGAGLCPRGEASSIGTKRAVEVSLLRELDLRGGIMW